MAKPRRSFLSAEDEAALEKTCLEAGVPTELVIALIEEETSVFGMGRRHGIRERIDALLTKFTEEDN